MAVFKCKMCGGSLDVAGGQSLVVCDYCGTQQTLPKIDDEKKLALFNRANNLRLKSEFDKAAGIYESIVAEFPEEAEAYWGLVLCKYGIEYVDDKDGKKIPTCHRTLPTSIMKDTDFEQACENADISAKAVYRDEAKAIDAIQKKILEIAGTEEPYDIFICYKETYDATGARTEDSSIAQDIYTALTEMGYKVFYARNSLRKVAGAEYEPYIYAALSSAKVMLAIGTKYDYYDAVWVKNEWSRFISMMADNTSKVLIPCYKNMDAYDIPAEFSNMQALDMADMMFFNSLESSVKRVLPLESKAAEEVPATNNGASATVESLLKRAFMFLEDKDWKSAGEYCEKVLDIDPENPQAYLGKLMIECKVCKLEDFKMCNKSFENSVNYQKLVRFGDDELKSTLQSYIDHIAKRKEEADAERIRKAEEDRAASQKKTIGALIAGVAVILVLALVSATIIPKTMVKDNAVVSVDTAEVSVLTNPVDSAALQEFQAAAKAINEQGVAGYNNITWQNPLKIEGFGILDSVIIPILGEYMTTEDEATVKQNAKGSDDAKLNMPLGNCTEGTIASCKKEGNTITIVMKDVVNPSYSETDGLAVMSRAFLDYKDVERVVAEDVKVSKIVKSIEGQIEYKEYTITAVMNDNGGFESITHCGVGYGSARVNGSIDAKCYIEFNSRYMDFVY